MFRISLIDAVVFELFCYFYSGDSMVSIEYTGYTEYTGKNNRNLPGMLFTTYDQDNDRYSKGNCGAIYGGGWWFNWCHLAHLHGPWASSMVSVCNLRDFYTRNFHYGET